MAGGVAPRRLKGGSKVIRTHGHTTREAAAGCQEQQQQHQWESKLSGEGGNALELDLADAVGPRPLRGDVLVLVELPGAAESAQHGYGRGGWDRQPLRRARARRVAWDPVNGRTSAPASRRRSSGRGR